MTIPTKPIGNLYSFDTDKTYDDNIKKAMLHFKTKYGCKAAEIWVRPEDAENVNGTMFCLDVVPRSNGVMPMFFILWRVGSIERTPVIFKGKRTPVL